MQELFSERFGNSEAKHINSYDLDQVTDFLKMEKHYIEVQKELDIATREREKGMNMLLC